MTGGLFGIIIPSSFLHFWGYHWVWLCWSMVLGHQCFATSSEWSRHELANLGLLCRWFTKRVIIVYYNTLIPAQLNSLEKTAERIVENPTAARSRAYRVSSLWLGSRWIGMNFLAENGTNGTRKPQPGPWPYLVQAAICTGTSADLRRKRMKKGGGSVMGAVFLVG